MVKAGCGWVWLGRAGEMEAACAENRKRGPAMGGSSTESAFSFHQRQ